jgi:serine/threonine protein kinase
MWWVKLADFGLSKKLTDSTAYHTKAGTQSYMAPEMLYSPDGSSDYTDAIDIWAVGCIAYRLVSGCVPFTIPALVQYCQDKSLFPLDPLFDCGIKSEGSKFLRHLLVTEPKDRPSASQALQHEWILSSEFYSHFLCYFSMSLMYVPCPPTAALDDSTC